MKKVFAVVGILMFAALLGVGFWTKDTQVNTPIRVGNLWAGKSGDARFLCYVTAEERARRRALTGGRNPSYTTDAYYRYRLHVRALPSGAIAQEVLLGDAKRNQGMPTPTIVGVIGDVLWLRHTYLEARALPTLEIRYDEAMLRKTEPATADLLPHEVAHYKVLASPAGLLTRGRDARFYLVDPARFTLAPVAATDLPRTSSSTRAENWFDFITTPAQGRTLTSPYNQMKRNLLTKDGMWYGLLSESERSDMAQWVSEEDRPSGDVARSLYRTMFKHDGRYAVVDPKAVAPVGNASFVQAGFVLRHDRGPWQVSDPASTLVLGKLRLGAAEPWEMIRLAHDGGALWQTSTGLTDPSEFLDAGPYFVMAGRPLPNSVGGPKADHRERIVWIEEKTGVKATLLVSTGELGK